MSSALTTVAAFHTVNLGFIRDHAQAIMRESPISYVKNAKLCGSVFELEDTSGIVSCVDTNFFVDHMEPLEALARVRENMDWPLGILLEGHEFLLILEV
jgi:regulation of enolase protein 1 (concanavalin A-like superfamily)